MSKFDDVDDFIVDVALRKLHKVTFTLMPQNWQAYDPIVELKWKVIRFGLNNANRIPDDYGGVYTFVVIPKVANHPRCANLIYVGETHQFRQRYKRYQRDKGDPKARPFVYLMLNLWEAHLWYCYARIDRTDLIHTVQNNLIRALDPVINRDYPIDVQREVTGAQL